MSDHEDEGTSRKKSKRIGVVTKAYKEPPAKTKKAPASTPATATKQASPKKPAKTSSPVKKEKKTPRYTVFDSNRKSVRKSTAFKTAATQIRIKKRTEEEKKKVKYVKAVEYIPTQEELLAEAKETEIENVKSLEKFMRLEMEKKKTRPTKRVPVGPIIRYHSMSLPLVEDMSAGSVMISPLSPVVKIEPMDVDGPSGVIEIPDETTDEAQQRPTKRPRTTQRSKKAIREGPKYARTFITFENDVHDKLFDSIFKKRPKRKVGPSDGRGSICPITKLPAKYFDPVTKVPYRSVAAFKIIREAYYRQLEERGNPENPQVAKWLIWRKQHTEQRVNKNKARLMGAQQSGVGTAVED